MRSPRRAPLLLLLLALLSWGACLYTSAVLAGSARDLDQSEYCLDNPEDPTCREAEPEAEEEEEEDEAPPAQSGLGGSATKDHRGVAATKDWRVVADKQALMELIWLYAAAVDAGDINEIRRIFLPEARIDYSAMLGPPKSDINTAVAFLYQATTVFTPSQHLMSNFLFLFEGANRDAALVTVELANPMGLKGLPFPFFTVYGKYTWRFVKLPESGRWMAAGMRVDPRFNGAIISVCVTLFFLTGAVKRLSVLYGPQYVLPVVLLLLTLYGNWLFQALSAKAAW